MGWCRASFDWGKLSSAHGKSSPFPVRIAHNPLSVKKTHVPFGESHYRNEMPMKGLSPLANDGECLPYLHDFGEGFPGKSHP